MSWIKISSQNTNKSELNGRRKTFLCPVSAWRQSPVQAVSCSRSRRPDEASGLQPPQPRTVRATPPRSTHQRDCSRYPYLVHIYSAHCYCFVQISIFEEVPLHWSRVYKLQVVILLPCRDSLPSPALSAVIESIISQQSITENVMLPRIMLCFWWSLWLS